MNYPPDHHSASRYTYDHRDCATCRELKRLYQLDYRARLRQGRDERKRARLQEKGRAA